MRQELFLPYFMEDRISKTERRKVYLLIALSIVLGLTLLSIGIYIVPKDCELLGDDFGYYYSDSICIKCENEPQPCLDDMGNLGARIIAGLGLFFVLLPPLYPFIEDFQKKKIVENKLFD